MNLFTVESMGIILNPRMLKPDFGLYFFTFLNLVALGTIVFFVIRYLLKKGRGRTKALVLFVFIASAISSCQVEHESIDTKQQVEKLIRDFNLVKSDQVTSKNALVFNNVDEAQIFFKALSSKNKFKDAVVINAFARAANISQTTGSARLYNTPGPCSHTGIVHDDIGIMPWNGFSIDANVNTDNHHIENVNTTLTGITFPFSAQQKSYEEDAVTYTPNGTVTTLTVVVTLTVNVFFEGIGSVYATEYTLRGYVTPCPTGGMKVEFEELY